MAVPIISAVAGATTLLGFFWVLKKLIGGMIPASIGSSSLYLGGLMVVFPLPFFVGAEWKGDPSFKKGILLALLVGAFIALADAFTIFLFQKGANLNIITPLVSGGAVAVAALAGFFLFKEPHFPYTRYRDYCDH